MAATFKQPPEENQETPHPSPGKPGDSSPKGRAFGPHPTALRSTTFPKGEGKRPTTIPYPSAGGGRLSLLWRRRQLRATRELCERRPTPRTTSRRVHRFEPKLAYQTPQPRNPVARAMRARTNPSVAWRRQLPYKGEPCGVRCQAARARNLKEQYNSIAKRESRGSNDPLAGPGTASLPAPIAQFPQTRYNTRNATVNTPGGASPSPT